MSQILRGSILARMDAVGFWRTVWEEDIRGPLRDVIRQIFFLGCTAFLQAARRVLDATGVAPWLQSFIATVTDGLTVVALAVLFIVIAFGLLRSGWKSVRNSD